LLIKQIGAQVKQPRKGKSHESRYNVKAS